MRLSAGVLAHLLQPDVAPSLLLSPLHLQRPRHGGPEGQGQREVSKHNDRETGEANVYADLSAMSMGVCFF